MRRVNFLMLQGIGFFLLASPLHAAVPTYTSIAEIGQNEFVVRVQQLGDDDERAHCTLASLSCTQVDQSFSLSEKVVTADILSPDGRYLASYSPSTASSPTRSISIYDTLTSKTYTHTEENLTYWDLLSEGLRIFAFSPDSKKLLYVSDEGGFAVLYEVDLSKLAGEKFTGTKIITKQYTVIDFGWIDANTIYFTANREHPLKWALYRYAPGTGSLLKIDDNISYGAPVKAFADGFLYTVIQGTAALPHYYDPVSGGVKEFSVEGVESSPASQGELVRAGGLSGVYMPSSVPTNTLLVWLHGGPYRQTSLGYHSYFSYAGYDWMLEEAQKGGVAVLKLDYPGSFGYGRKAAESIRLSVGKKDVADTDAAIQQFASSRGFTNIYLIGNSYGGYLAPKMLVERLATYKGAFAINGVWDWSSLTYQLSESIFNVQFDGVESPQNEELYKTAEVISKLPLLGTQRMVIAHGEEDTTIPYSQSKNAYDMLALAGKNAELISFRDEDHVYKKERTFERLCRAVLEFTGGSAEGRCEIEN